MFRTFACLVTLLLIVTVLPCYADHDHDSDRPSDAYSGHDGQTTLADPNDIGTPSFNDIRSTLDPGPATIPKDYYPVSTSKDPSPTPPSDFSKIKAPTVHLNFESNSEGDESPSKELQDYRKAFTSILDYRKSFTSILDSEIGH